MYYIISVDSFLSAESVVETIRRFVIALFVPKTINMQLDGREDFINLTSTPIKTSFFLLSFLYKLAERLSHLSYTVCIFFTKFKNLKVVYNATKLTKVVTKRFSANKLTLWSLIPNIGC